MVLKLISEVEPRAKVRPSVVAAIVKLIRCPFLLVQRYLCVGSLLRHVILFLPILAPFENFTTFLHLRKF